MVSLMESDPDYPVLVQRFAELKMNSDPVPDHSNRMASLLGRIFHPAIIAIPTLLIVLSELGWNEALRWSLLALPIVLIPGLIAVSFWNDEGARPISVKLGHRCISSLGSA